MRPVTLYCIELEANDAEALVEECNSTGVVMENVRPCFNGDLMRFWCLQPEPLVSLCLNWGEESLMPEYNGGHNIASGIRAVVMLAGLVEVPLEDALVESLTATVLKGRR